MKLEQLVALFRAEVDDTAAPYLWTDPEVIDYAADAEMEACRRALLLIDSSTAATCQYTVAPGASVVTLDTRVLYIGRAKISGQNTPLSRRLVEFMDADKPGWESDTGTPEAYITDWETGKIRLYPAWTAGGTLNLTVARLPLTEMDDLGGDEPEIRPEFHRSLRFWMLYRAYSKKDRETEDPEKAQANLALFEAEFGPRSSALAEEQRRMQQVYERYIGTGA